MPSHEVTAAPPQDVASTALPALSGGTMIVRHDGTTIVAADPDTDAVWIVTGPSAAPIGIPLRTGDEPGRLVEDSAGRVHVVLRGSGAIATIDSAHVTQRRAVCAEPRGIAYELPGDELYVSCTDGRIMKLPASHGEAQTFATLDDDLRDLAIIDGSLFVTRFRSAELLQLDATGAVVARTQPAGFATIDGARAFSPSVAWRMIGTPSGPVTAFQQGEDTAIALGDAPQAMAYGGTSLCNPSVVQTQLTLPGGTIALPGSLPLDVAIDGNHAAVVSAGDSSILEVPVWSDTSVSCTSPGLVRTQLVAGRPVAVAYTTQNLVVQVREPSGVYFLRGPLVKFPVQPPVDLGRDLFHAQAPAGVACASCHPEGREDGRVWRFAPGGARRTQSLAGGLLATAPFHWDGSFGSMDALLDDVLVHRMGGGKVSTVERGALAKWLDTVPAPARRAPSSSEAGAAVFVRAGCASCHAGAHLTDDGTHDVGTGGAFQVPSLIGLGARAPYMHDGCAKTLEQRFTDAKCGGGERHGATSQLTAVELSDLVVYLKSL